MIRAGLGAAASILSVSVLGFLLVGRPMRRLTDFAKRIGSGDLGARWICGSVTRWGSWRPK